MVRTGNGSINHSLGTILLKKSLGDLVSTVILSNLLACAMGKAASVTRAIKGKKKK